MIRCLIFALLLAGYAQAVFAADDGGGGNFLTQTISDVVTKVSDYTSGEKGILDPDYRKPEKARTESDLDPLGRKIAEPAIKPLKRPPAAPGTDADKEVL